MFSLRIKRLGISAVMIFVIAAVLVAAWSQEQRRVWALKTLARAQASFDGWASEHKITNDESEEEEPETEFDDDGSYGDARIVNKENFEALAAHYGNYPSILVINVAPPSVISPNELGKAIRIINPRALVIRSPGPVDQALLDHIGQAHRLSSLDLGGTFQLTDSQLASLKGLHRLRQFHLRGVQGVTLRSLGLFTSWPNLKVLDLKGAGIPPADIQKVKQELPLVSVVE